MMIVNDNFRVINKLETSLIDNARVVIYDHHMLQATGNILEKEIRIWWALRGLGKPINCKTHIKNAMSNWTFKKVLKSNVNKFCKKPLKAHLHFVSVWDVADAFTQMFVTNFVKVNCKIQRYIPNVAKSLFYLKIIEKSAWQIDFFHVPQIFKKNLPFSLVWWTQILPK